MKKGKITSGRVGRAINYIESPFSGVIGLESDKEDYALIADIIKLIASKDYMSTNRAQGILRDSERIIPYITELNLL